MTQGLGRTLGGERPPGCGELFLILQDVHVFVSLHLQGGKGTEGNSRRAPGSYSSLEDVPQRTTHPEEAQEAGEASPR